MGPVRGFEDWGCDGGGADDGFWGTARGVGLEHCGEAGFLEGGEPRGKLRWELQIGLGDVGFARMADDGDLDRETCAPEPAGGRTGCRGQRGMEG